MREMGSNSYKEEEVGTKQKNGITRSVKNMSQNEPSEVKCSREERKQREHEHHFALNDDGGGEDGENVISFTSNPRASLT